MYVGIHGVPAGWIDPRNLSSPPALVQPQIPKVKMFLVTLVAPHVSVLRILCVASRLARLF